MSEKEESRLTLPVGARDHIEGPESAAVTLVEYGDYECPYCRSAFPIVKRLQSALGSGLRFVFRNFPLTKIHSHAQHAAEAAEASAAQGHFAEMHAVLFKNQHALTDSDLRDYAAGIGMDVQRFEQELSEHVYAARVREDFMSGLRSGVNGTPTFFINGMRHNGAWDLEFLLEAIQRASVESFVQ